VGTSKTRGEQVSTTSLKAAVQPGHWLRALIYKNNIQEGDILRIRNNEELNRSINGESILRFIKALRII
jgi:hypothetical protein